MSRPSSDRPNSHFFQVSYRKNDRQRPDPHLSLYEQAERDAQWQRVRAERQTKFPPLNPSADTRRSALALRLSTAEHSSRSKTGPRSLNSSRRCVSIGESKVPDYSSHNTSQRKRAPSYRPVGTTSSKPVYTSPPVSTARSTVKPHHSDRPGQSARLSIRTSGQEPPPRPRRTPPRGRPSVPSTRFCPALQEIIDKGSNASGSGAQASVPGRGNVPKDWPTFHSVAASDGRFGR